MSVEGQLQPNGELMTTMTEIDYTGLTLPTVGETIADDHDEMVHRMNVMPVGTVVTQRGDDSWTKGTDGRWDEVEAESFICDDEFCVQSYPATGLTETLADGLPTGTVVIRVGQASGLMPGAWVKLADNNWSRWGRRNEQTGQRNSLVFTGSFTSGTDYHWVLPFAPNAVVEPVAETTDPVAEPVAITLRGSEVTEGMLVTIENHRIYVRSIEGTNWQVYRWVIEGEGEFTQFQSGAHSFGSLARYTLTRQSDEFMAMITALDQQRQSIEYEVTQRVTNSRDRHWERQLEGFNSAIHQWVENESVDSDFDELMSNHSGLGMTPRSRDYTVDFQVHSRVTMRVSASSADEACEMAKREMAVSEGYSFTLNGESAEVTYVNDGEAEED